jgi:hypothetical protein
MLVRTLSTLDMEFPGFGEENGAIAGSSLPGRAALIGATAGSDNPTSAAAPLRFARLAAS